MKRIIYITLTAMLVLLNTACEKDFDRDSDPMVIFNTTDYPLLEGFITIDEAINGQKLILAYKYGQGKEVTISIPEQTGIYADEQTVTLAADEGTISIPLKGIAIESGIMTLKTRISYGDYHIFCEKEIGVRPADMDDIEIVTEPIFSGQLYKDLPASNASVPFDYVNGWSRTATVWFTCDDPGILDTPETYTLVLDDQLSSLVIPLPGKPETDGIIDITMHLQFEGGTEQTFVFNNIEILQAIPYDEETVSHTIIITDRNTLIANSESIEYNTFTYKTVFVDMNGDGYVSSNAEIWLDRNVGATSTDVTSEDSYGFIYQPGRGAPGWVAGSQGGSTYKGEPYALNNANWYNGTTKSVTVNKLDATGAVSGTVTIGGGKVGPNNPCPEGFRPPTGAEWTALYNYLGCTSNSYSALKDGLLKLPYVGGYLANTNTQWVDKGEKGYYWAAPFDNNQVPAIYFANTPPVANRMKGMGMPVRCIKAKESELATY